MNLAISEVKDVQALMDLTQIQADMGRATLKHCLIMSEVAWEAKIDGELACVWGLIPPTMMSDQAYLWMHATDVADQHTFLLVRYSQLWIKAMLTKFPTIVGHCAKDAKRSQRWLRWLGAKFTGTEGSLLNFVIEAPNG